VEEAEGVAVARVPFVEEAEGVAVSAQGIERLQVADPGHA